MTPDQADRHGRAEDERARAAREKRIKERATAEAYALAKRRGDALLPYTELRYDPDDEGCVW